MYTPHVIDILLFPPQAVRRVTLEGVWLVHNAGDTELIRGPGGLFGEQQRSEWGGAGRLVADRGLADRVGRPALGEAHVNQCGTQKETRKEAKARIPTAAYSSAQRS